VDWNAQASGVTFRCIADLDVPTVHSLLDIARGLLTKKADSEVGASTSRESGVKIECPAAGATGLLTKVHAAGLCA
jgi:hypothetical protein